MLEYLWNSLPIGKENAASYSDLCLLWGMDKRKVRQKLHDLSLYDSGDNYILIRSCRGKGFYKTDNPEEIQAFKKECINKAKSNFSPLRKINRVLNGADDTQMSFSNNLLNARLAKGLTQAEVIETIKTADNSINVALLSQFENSACIPTPYQLCLFARIYGCKPSELINYEQLLGA